MYGRVIDGVCTWQGSLPRDVAALGLDDAGLAALGWWPIVFDPDPMIDPIYEALGDAVETLDADASRIVLARPILARPVDDVRADLLVALVDPPHDPLWEALGDVIESTDEAGRLVLAREVVDRPVADIRVDLVAAVEGRLQTAFGAGFSWDFGDLLAVFEDGSVGPAGPQVLQTRDLYDRTNWLILDAGCTKLIAIGAGDTMVPARTTSNATVAIAAADCSAMLAAMAANGQAKMGRSWMLKNLIRQAEDIVALQAIDIDGGW